MHFQDTEKKKKGYSHVKRTNQSDLFTKPISLVSCSWSLRFHEVMSSDEKRFLFAKPEFLKKIKSNEDLQRKCSHRLAWYPIWWLYSHSDPMDHTHLQWKEPVSSQCCAIFSMKKNVNKVNEKERSGMNNLAHMRVERSTQDTRSWSNPTSEPNPSWCFTHSKFQTIESVLPLLNPDDHSTSYRYH